MHKILLVVDDFTELEAMESLLKRIGFDVLAIGKDLLVNDALLRFQPEIVLATLKGRAVDGTKLAIRLKALKTQTPPQVALLWSGIGLMAGAPPRLAKEVAAHVDALLVYPLSPVSLIQAVAKLSGSVDNSIIKKFERIGIQVSWPSSLGSLITGYSDSTTETKSETTVRGKSTWDPIKAPGQAAIAVSERTSRYNEFLKKHDEPVVGVLTREATAEAARLLRAAETKQDKLDLEALYEERKAFTAKLFSALPEAEAEQPANPKLVKKSD